MKKFYKEFWAHFNSHPHEVRLGTALLVFLALLCVGKWIVDALVPFPPTPDVFHYVSSREIIHGDTSKKDVIFTFDGGATAESGDAILAALSRHHVKGTFFLTGKFVEAYPDLVRRIVAGGNEVFSHTYDHPHLPTLSDAGIVGELDQMAGVLGTTAGISPKPFFRAPYGDRDARVLFDAYNNGYESVYWTVDAGDWEESTGKTADEVRNTILNTLAPGNIYLIHVGDTISGAILDDVMTQIEARGYRVVSLTEGL